MDRLHLLAPHYWNKPETADCTIVVPLSSRRNVHSGPRMTLRLHRAYLFARSAFLRGLFSGVSPIDLVQVYASRLQSPTVPCRVPQSRLPRLFPSPPSHPVVFLPIPDPSSIRPLLHWIYFDTTDHIENALDQGDIQWEGLARNVEYLGLSVAIKVFLGCWYRNRFLPTQLSPDCVPCPTDEDDEGSSPGCDDDLDADEYYSPSAPPSDDKICRVHARDVKPLVQLCVQLRLCTTH